MDNEKITSINEGAEKPRFVFEFTETYGEWSTVFKSILFRKIPLWLAVIELICLMLITFDLFLMGDTVPSFFKVIAIIVVITAILIFFLPNIESRLKISAAKQMSGGVKYPTKYTISDKIYIDEGNIHQEFNFEDVTGIYEKDNLIIIKLHKTVYGYISRSAMNDIEAQKLINYLRMNTNLPKEKKAGKIFFPALVIILCLVTALYTGAALMTEVYVKNHISYMSAEELAKLNDTQLFEGLMKSYDSQYNYSVDYYSDEFDTFYTVGEFYNEFENGGLCSYWYNTEGKYSDDLEEALIEIGCEDIAEEYQKFIDDNNINDFDCFYTSNYDTIADKYPYDDFNNSDKVNDDELFNSLMKYVRNNLDSITQPKEELI